MSLFLCRRCSPQSSANTKEKKKKKSKCNIFQSLDLFLSVSLCLCVVLHLSLIPTCDPTISTGGIIDDGILSLSYTPNEVLFFGFIEEDELCPFIALFLSSGVFLGGMPKSKSSSSSTGGGAGGGRDGGRPKSAKSGGGRGGGASSSSESERGKERRSN